MSRPHEDTHELVSSHLKDPMGPGGPPEGREAPPERRCDHLDTPELTDNRQRSLGGKSHSSPASPSYLAPTDVILMWHHDWPGHQHREILSDAINSHFYNTLPHFEKGPLGVDLWWGKIIQGTTRLLRLCNQLEPVPWLLVIPTVLIFI